MAAPIGHGPGAMAQTFTVITSLAMQIKLEQTLEAESHQRSADRKGYGNGKG